MSRRWAAGALVGLGLGGLGLLGRGLGGCATLPDIQQNQCGNGIVELPHDEDCDSHNIGLDGGIDDEDGGFQCSAATCRVACTFPDAGADMGADAGAGQCASAAVGACPWGWGCGNDGICRRPNGAFQSLGVRIHEGAERLKLADLDGNGRQDIVVDTGSQLVVHYVDGTGAVSRTSAFTVSEPTPAVGDFDGDGIADVAYRLDTAFTVRLGNPDQTLQAQPFAAPLPAMSALQPLERIIAIKAEGITSGQKLKELVRVKPTSLETLLPDPTQLPMPNVVTLVSGAGSAVVPVGSNIVAARWIDASQCDQILIPNKTTNAFEIYATCETVGNKLVWNDATAMSATPPITVPFPAGLLEVGPVFALDVDGDGHKDLVFYAAVDALKTKAEIQVAYGDGKGHFGSTPVTFPTWSPPAATGSYMCLGVDTKFSPPDAIQLNGCETLPPLAIGDFNGDGHLDLVTPCGIFLFDPGNPKALSCNPGNPFVLDVAETSRQGLVAALWTQARAVDLNGDGLLDVVAASCADTSILYFESNGGDYFNPYLIPTVGGVDNLAVGDFDGDFVKDIIYTERGGADPECGVAALPATSVTLTAVFGAYSGGPSAPIPLARLDQSVVDQMVPSQLTDLTGQFNPISNLVLIREGRGGPLLDIFEGSTNRDVVAPYFLVAPDTVMSAHPENAANTPWLTTMGDFGGQAKGLAMLTSERYQGTKGLAHKARLWLFSQPGTCTCNDPPTTSCKYQPGTVNDGVLDLTSPQPVDVTALGDPTDYAGDNATKGAWLTTVKLGGGQTDSIVGLMQDTGAGLSGLLVETPSNGALAGTNPSPVSLPGAYAGPIVVGDVDADGADDLVLVSTDDVLVLWNKGSFSAGGASRIAPDATKCDSTHPGKEHVLAATVARTATGLPRQVVFVTVRAGAHGAQNHAYLASLDAASPSSHAFTVSCLDSSLFNPPVPLFSSAVLVAGDVDGDGVDDVVLGASDLVQIFHGVPVIQ